jgi:hypothetical protein
VLSSSGGATGKKDQKAMKQKEKLKQMPAKSRDWLEAECLRLASRTPGGKEIQRVTIRRLHPRGTGANWKVADLIPQPALAFSAEVRASLADLPTTYALETE